MKFLSVLTLLFVTYVTYLSAQECLQQPPDASCVGPRNVGRVDRNCLARPMWYYNARRRQCLQMRYLGCGGNKNRWCSQATCEQRCRR